MIHIERTRAIVGPSVGIVRALDKFQNGYIMMFNQMNPQERLNTLLLSLKLGPVTRFCGVVNGLCECGEMEGIIQVWDRKRHRYKDVDHKPGKHPPRGVVGWQGKNASRDLGTVARWCAEHPTANFAVISGVDSVVLDLDVRPGKDGVAELKQIEATTGQKLPATVTVLSGSGTGAMHLYFRVPPDIERLQKPKGTKGIDFQRNRQAVIVPGSAHVSGHYYEYAPGLSPADVELAELPSWLLERMTQPTATSRTSSATANKTDDIDQLFDALLREGPPNGSMPPGRTRSDDVIKRKMKSVSMRMYGDNRSHSDSHWAWTLARNCCHHWDQYLRIWKGSSIRDLPDTKCGRASYEKNILKKAFLDQTQQWKNRKRGPIAYSGAC